MHGYACPTPTKIVLLNGFGAHTSGEKSKNLVRFFDFKIVLEELVCHQSFTKFSDLAIS